MSLSLFDISTEFYALKDLVDNDLEVNEETGEIVDNSMELKKLFVELKMSLEDKLDNTQRYLLTLDGEIDILDKEIKRLQAKKQSVNNKKDRLKKIVLSTLENTGLGKIKTALYSFSIKETESVEIVDFDSLGRNFLRLKKEADKKAIKEAIKNGDQVDGAKIVKNKSLGVR
jgi:phage host-nuclease inhibitor protein Gam